MSFIKYVGPFDEVEVEGLTCKRLQTIEVPPSLAGALRDQEDWEQPKSKSNDAKRAVKNPDPPIDPAVAQEDVDPDPEAVPVEAVPEPTEPEPEPANPVPDESKES